MSKKGIVYLIILLLLILAVISISLKDEIIRLGSFIITVLEKKEAIRDFVLSLGPFGPLGFILLQALQVVLSPIPGEATGIVGGFIFGKWLGLIYSTIGLSLGSAMAFFISRYFRHIVEPWLKKSELYFRFEGLLRHQGIFICFFLYVFPGFPKDFLCYLLGLTRMPWQIFVFISSIGRIPGTLMLSWQGADIYNGNWVGVFSIIALTVIVAGPAWLYRERIYSWVEEKTKDF